jgi:hypothetical protein
MSRGLLAVGAGITGCLSTITLTCRSGQLRNIPSIVSVTSFATALLALAATRVCKDKGQGLDKRDYIIVGGASFIGSAAGGAAVVGLAAMFSVMFMGSMMGTLIGNIFSMPFHMNSYSMTRINYYR